MQSFQLALVLDPSNTVLLDNLRRAREQQTVERTPRVEPARQSAEPAPPPANRCSSNDPNGQMHCPPSGVVVPLPPGAAVTPMTTAPATSQSWNAPAAGDLTGGRLGTAQRAFKAFGKAFLDAVQGGAQVAAARHIPLVPSILSLKSEVADARKMWTDLKGLTQRLVDHFGSTAIDTAGYLGGDAPRPDVEAASDSAGRDVTTTSANMVSRRLENVLKTWRNDVASWFPNQAAREAGDAPVDLDGPH